MIGTEPRDVVARCTAAISSLDLLSATLVDEQGRPTHTLVKSCESLAKRICKLRTVVSASPRPEPAAPKTVRARTVKTAPKPRKVRRNSRRRSKTPTPTQ